MITIPTLAETAIPHRAYLVAGSPAGRIVVTSPDHRWTVLEANLSRVGGFRARGKLTDVAVARSGDLVALCTGRELSLHDPADGREWYSIEVGERAASAFHDTRGLIWTLFADGGKEFVVQVRDAADGRVLREESFGVSNRDSVCSFHSHPQLGAIAVWAAAGQDGQSIVWVSDDGAALEIEPLARVDECTPPLFSAGGSSFLLVEGGALCRWDLARLERTARIDDGPWSLEDDQLAESITWAGARRAIVTTDEGRLFLVDLDEGRTIYEACISGHEPGPIGAIWPSLAHEEGIGSDLSHFVTLPSGRVLSVHHVPTAEDDEEDDDASVTNRIVAWDPVALAG